MKKFLSGKKDEGGHCCISGKNQKNIRLGWLRVGVGVRGDAEYMMICAEGIQRFILKKIDFWVGWI